MPSVPITTERSREIAPLGNERLRYDAPRNFVGPAVEGFGQALGKAAEGLDQIEAAYDQADVLNSDNTLASEVSATQSEFGQLKGDQPGRELDGRIKAVSDRADQLVGSARSERARNMMRRSLAVRVQNARERLTTHADAEMFKFRDSALEAGALQAVDDAIGAAGTDQFGTMVGVGLTRIEERAAINGAPAQVTELAKTKFLDQVHGGVLDQMFALPIPKIDDIGQYLADHKDQMTPKLRNATLGRLQAPLQGRAARSGADAVMGFGAAAAPVEGAPTPAQLALPKGPQGEVGAELTKAGYSPAVVAGFLGNFEVEGGYGGAQGDGGSASGIAQWRNERRGAFRRKFGKEPHQATAAEQAKFVVWEMQNPGEAGMTIAQRDAILAADTPGKAAALIDQHYERSSGAHRAARQDAAQKVHGGDYESTPREWDRTQIYDNLEAVAKRENWDPEHTERVRTELDRRISRDEGLLKERRDDAVEAAMNIVGAKGDGFRAHMIPSDVRANMTPAQWAGILEIEEKLTAPERVKPNGPRAVELDRMARLDPEAFKTIDLRKEVGSIAPSELNALSNMQADLLGPKGAKIIRYSDDARSTIAIYATPDMKITGKDGDKHDYLRVHSLIQHRLEAVTRGEREATDAERKEAFNYATMTVVFDGGVFGGDDKVRIYDLSLDQVPATTRKQAEDALRAAGREATPAAVLELVRKSIMIKARARGN